MGQVYLASDTKFASRKVAVKTVRQDILRSDDLQEGEAIARFGREAEAAAAPNTKDCPYCRMPIPVSAVRCPHCTSELK